MFGLDNLEWLSFLFTKEVMNSQNNTKKLSKEAEELYRKTMLNAIGSSRTRETLSAGLTVAMMDILNPQWKAFVADHYEVLNVLDKEKMEALRDLFVETMGVGHKIYWTEQVEIKNRDYSNFTKLAGQRYVDHLIDEYKKYFTDEKPIEKFPPHILELADKFALLGIEAFTTQNSEIIATLGRKGGSQTIVSMFADAQKTLASLVFVGYVLAFVQDEFIDSIGVEIDTGDVDLNVLEVDDEMYKEVTEYIKDLKEIKTSVLQKRFRIGYGKAARLIDRLEEDGLVEVSDDSSTARRVL